MKRIILAALLLTPLPARAQQNIVSVVVTSPAVGSIIQQWTLTDDEMVKFEAWLQYAYPCKPPAPGEACVGAPTDLLIASIKAWETATINGTVDNVNRAGAQKAAADAISGITPIVPQLAGKTEGKKK
jgi:hypothetical protein